MSTNGVDLNGGVDGAAVWSAQVLPLESQDSMSVVNVEGVAAGKPQAVGDEVRYDVCSEATSGWTRRIRIGKALEEREMNPNRKSALGLSLRAYAEKREGPVVYPSIGTSFDSLDEAYEFYNLYSWECWFGVGLAKSRLNVEEEMHARDCVRLCGVTNGCSCAAPARCLPMASSSTGCVLRQGRGAVPSSQSSLRIR